MTMLPAVIVSAAIAGNGVELSPVYEIHTRAMKIPVEYDLRRVVGIKSLELWVSEDRGRSWSRVSVIEPKDEQFVTAVYRDGEYWYGLHIEMKNGTVEPPHRRKPNPIQRVRVRTAAAVTNGIRINLGLFGVTIRVVP
ncbi:MAG TPA: hypothetical protein VFG68_15370 [Fimbriiglobus sp.]|nr:hypothetical protein [Fimbriiglobus sp.]